MFMVWSKAEQYMCTPYGSYKTLSYKNCVENGQGVGTFYGPDICSEC